MRECLPVDQGSGLARFVFRTHEKEPWNPGLFSSFGDGTPYFFSGGRATPRRDD